jgi:TM2 domain-containing membrane protein YozV
MRVGTREREHVVELLGQHFAAGRINASEYEERLLAATSAVTLNDISGLFADLPQPHPAFLAPPQPIAPRFQPPVMRPPYAVDPHEQSDRSRVVAGVLNILLPFGIGRFYTGHTGLAVAQLLVTLFTFGAGALWPFIDGIVLLAYGGTDRYGRRLHD